MLGTVRLTASTEGQAVIVVWSTLLEDCHEQLRPHPDTGGWRAALGRNQSDRLGISNRVHFDRTISSAAMPAYLQQLDVLVLSSRTRSNWKEQFGRALVEAMACGVAVIGSDSGEIPYVIGSAGFVFPEDDVGALRSHLLKLMQSQEQRRQLGQHGRQRVLAKYTQAQVAAQTVAVYRKLMEQEISRDNHGRS